MLVAVGVTMLITVNIILISFAARHRSPSFGLGQTGIAIVAPFQEAFSRTLRLTKNIWRHYFHLVAVSKENDELKQTLNNALERHNRYREIELSNLRLRRLLDFKRKMDQHSLSAEVIGKDPSPWFKSIIVDKGKNDGISVGFPVVVPEGIVGQITEVSAGYAKVLMVIDRNNAVDGLVQRTRARGIIQGTGSEHCIFKYVLRKHDIRINDTIISSGLDRVFPKGLGIGRVAEIIKNDSGIFQEITITPFVDFEKLEEVLIIIMPSSKKGQTPPDNG